MKTGPSELPRSEELHNEDSSGLDQLPQVLNLTSPLSGSGSGLVGRLQRYILDDCFHKLATRLRSTKPETQALLPSEVLMLLQMGTVQAATCGNYDSTNMTYCEMMNDGGCS